MAIIKKYSPYLNLSNYQTFITDENPNSDYFNVTEFKETFSGGKNGFLIAGSPALRETTEIKIEILDTNGDPIYFEPGSGYPEYYEGTSTLVSVHVYDDTPIGIGKITILGELKEYWTKETGTIPVPEEWKNAYNVKWEKKFKVNKLILNEDKVRFYKRPEVNIDELTKPLFTVTTPIITQSGSVSGIPQVPTEGTDLSNWSAGTLYQLEITDGGTWTSSIDEHIVNIPSLNYSPVVKEILNNKNVLVDIPYSVNNIVKPFISEPYTSSFEYIEGQTVTGSALTGSFAHIKITNLKTFVGDVARVKIFRKSRNEVGDFQLTQDSKLESTELLRDLTIQSDTEINYGFFTETNIQNYWESSSNDHPVSLNVDVLQNSMFINYDEVIGGIQKIETKEFIPIGQDIEYTLNFKTRFVGTDYTGKKIKAYLSSSNFQQEFIEIDASPETTVRTKISQNIISSNTDDMKLVFEFTGNDWYISDVSLRNAQETSFSPDEFTLVQSIPRNLDVETFDFRFEFYDINNNYIPVEVNTSKTFDGGNLTEEATGEPFILFTSDKTAFRFSTGSFGNPPFQQVGFKVTKNNVTGSTIYTSGAYDELGTLLTDLDYPSGGYPGTLTNPSDVGGTLMIADFTGSVDTISVASITYTASVAGIEEYETIYRFEDGESVSALFVTANRNQFYYSDSVITPTDQEVIIQVKRANLVSNLSPIIAHSSSGAPALTFISDIEGVQKWSLSGTDYPEATGTVDYSFTGSDAFNYEYSDLVTISAQATPSGSQGSAGIDARTVKLGTPTYTITYDSDGLNPVPSGTFFLTASYQNFVAPLFQFTGDGITEDGGFVNGANAHLKEFTIPDNYFIDPMQVKIGMSENSQTEIAYDTIDIFALKPGYNGSSPYTVELSAPQYAISYDKDDNNPSPNGTLTLTAKSFNFNTPLYKFTGDGIVDDTVFDGTDTQTFTIPPNFFSSPMTIRVGVSDNDQVEKAHDVISIFGVKPGSDGFSTQFWYIKPLNGTQIKNSNGSLEFQAMYVSGSTTTEITSGPITIHDENGEVTVGGGITDGGNGVKYNPILNQDAITGQELLYLSGSSGILDTVTILDVTDGIAAGTIIANNLFSRRDSGSVDFSPNPLAVTASFFDTNGTENIEYLTISSSFNSGLGLDQMQYVVDNNHANIVIVADDGDGNIVPPNTNVSTKDLNIKATFTNPVTNAVTTAQETFYIISDGQDGEDSFTIFITNEAHTYPADETGFVSTVDANDGSFELRVFKGITPFTYGSGPGTYSVINVVETGITGAFGTTAQNQAEYIPSAVNQTISSGTVAFTIKENTTNLEFDKSYSWSKSIAGKDGFGSTFYLIRPLTGTQIKNSTGTLELQSYMISGSEHFDLTSANGANLKLYNGATELSTSMTGVTAGANGVLYNPIFDASGITGNLTISLKNGTVVVDTITLIDTGDGIPAGTVQANNLFTRRDAGAIIYAPTSLTVTASFYTANGTEFSEHITLTPVFENGFDYWYYTITNNNLNITLVCNDGDGHDFVGPGVVNKLATKDINTIFTFTDPILGDTMTAQETFYTISDGTDGDPGEDAYTVFLTNEAHTFPASSQGDITDYPSGETEVRVFKGTQKLNFGVSGVDTYSIVSIVTPTLTMTFSNTGTDAKYTPSAATADSGVATIIIKDNTTNTEFTKLYTWSKSIRGQDGTGADFSMITAVNGTQIKNNTGTLEIVAQRVSGSVITDIETPSTIALYDGTTLLTTGMTGVTAGSNGVEYNAIFNSSGINGTRIITLKDGPSGLPLDTITLIDVTDGIAAGSILANNLFTRRESGTSTYLPTLLVATASFFDTDGNEYTSKFTLTPNLSGVTDRWKYNINSSDPEITVSVNNGDGTIMSDDQYNNTKDINTIFTFTDPKTSKEIKAQETFYIISDGIDGTDGTDGNDGEDGIDGVSVSVTPPNQMIVSGSSGYGTPHSFKVTVLEGTNTYTYDGSSPYADSTFRIANLTNGTNSSGTITPTTPTSDSDLDTTFNVMYVTSKGTSKTVPYTHKTTIIKDGKDGINGSSGTSAQVVSISATKYTVPYLSNGNIKDGTNITFTATQQNVTSPQYRFLRNGGQVQGWSGTNTYSYPTSTAIPGAGHTDLIQAEVRSGGSGNYIAFDNTDVFGIQDAAGGANTVSVKLLANKYTIIYNSNGIETPSNQTVTFTATSQNVTNPQYRFTRNNGATQVQDWDTDDTYVFSATNAVPGANSAEDFRVQVRSGTGIELTTDNVDISGLRDGADGSSGTNGKDAMTVIVTNESHTLSTNNSGTVVYTGSGTKIYVYEGITSLSYNGSGTANSTWKVTTSATNIVANTSFTDSGTYVTIGNHSGMNADVASITYTITGKRSNGQTFSIEKVQSFAKSKEGEDGANALSGYLTNETETVPTDQNGNGANYSTAGGKLVILYGTIDRTANASLSIDGGTSGSGIWTKVQNGLTMSLDTSGGGKGSYSLSGASWTTDTETFTLKGTYSGITISKSYTITKAKAGSNGSNGTPARYVKVSGDQVFKYTNNQLTGTPTPSTITLTGAKYNTGSGYRWEYHNGTSWTLCPSPYNAITRDFVHNENIWGTKKSLRVRFSNQNSTRYYDETTLMKVGDGDDGQNALSGYLTNETETVPTDSNGNGANYSTAGGGFKILYGAVDRTANASLIIVGGSSGSGVYTQTKSGLTMTLDTSGTGKGNYSLAGSSWLTDSETFEFRGTYAGGIINKTYTITKAKAGGDGSNGSNGTPARYVKVSGDQVFKYTNNQLSGTPTPSSIILTGTRYNTGSGYRWEYYSGTTWTLCPAPYNTASRTFVHNENIWGTKKSLRVRFSNQNSTRYYDETTLMKVGDGDDGTDSYTVFLTNDSHTFAAPASGTSGVDFAGGKFECRLFEGTIKRIYSSSLGYTVRDITLDGITGNWSTVSSQRVFTPTGFTNSSVTDGSVKLNIRKEPENIDFTKTYTFSISRKGNTGNTGSTGATGVTGPGVVHTGPWVSTRSYQLSATRKDTCERGGVYYLNKQNGNTNHQPPHSYWESLGTQDYFVAAKIIISDDSYVKKVLNIGSTTGNKVTANITLDGSSTNPYFSLGQNPVGVYGGNGIFIGRSGGYYRASFVNGTSNYFKWTGTTLDIRGKITATSGYIGGWRMDSNSIYTGTKDYTGFTTTGITFYRSGVNGSIHTKNFYVDLSGNAAFRGSISATSIAGGSISGTTIEGGSFYSPNSASPNFSVDSVGNLFANSAVISGSISADDGEIGNWKIEHKNQGGTLHDVDNRIVLEPNIPELQFYNSSDEKKVSINPNDVLTSTYGNDEYFTVGGNSITAPAAVTTHTTDRNVVYSSYRRTAYSVGNSAQEEALSANTLYTITPLYSIGTWTPTTTSLPSVTAVTEGPAYNNYPQHPGQTRQAYGTQAYSYQYIYFEVWRKNTGTDTMVFQKQIRYSVSKGQSKSGNKYVSVSDPTNHSPTGYVWDYVSGGNTMNPSTYITTTNTATFDVPITTAGTHYCRYSTRVGNQSARKETINSVGESNMTYLSFTKGGYSVSSGVDTSITLLTPTNFVELNTGGFQAVSNSNQYVQIKRLSSAPGTNPTLVSVHGGKLEIYHSSPSQLSLSNNGLSALSGEVRLGSSSSHIEMNGRVEWNLTYSADTNFSTTEMLAYINSGMRTLYASSTSIISINLPTSGVVNGTEINILRPNNNRTKIYGMNYGNNSTGQYHEFNAGHRFNCIFYSNRWFLLWSDSRT